MFRPLRRAAAALALLTLLTACASENRKPAEQALARASVLRANPASANDGARVYLKNCSSCHQADGAGIPGAFPPLADNPAVTGSPARVIAIVKLGTRGKLRVSGVTYDGTMPAWGQLITDDDIAAVVTYIRTAWRNRATAVTLADVQAVGK